MNDATMKSQLAEQRERLQGALADVTGIENADHVESRTTETGGYRTTVCVCIGYNARIELWLDHAINGQPRHWYGFVSALAEPLTQLIERLPPSLRPSCELSEDDYREDKKKDIAVYSKPDEGKLTRPFYERDGKKEFYFGIYEPATKSGEPQLNLNKARKFVDEVLHSAERGNN